MYLLFGLFALLLHFPLLAATLLCLPAPAAFSLDYSQSLIEIPQLKWLQDKDGQSESEQTGVQAPLGSFVGVGCGVDSHQSPVASRQSFSVISWWAVFLVRSLRSCRRSRVSVWSALSYTHTHLLPLPLCVSGCHFCGNTYKATLSVAPSLFGNTLATPTQEPTQTHLSFLPPFSQRVSNRLFGLFLFFFCARVLNNTLRCLARSFRSGCLTFDQLLMSHSNAFRLQSFAVKMSQLIKVIDWEPSQIEKAKLTPNFLIISTKEYSNNIYFSKSLNRWAVNKFLAHLK